MTRTLLAHAKDARAPGDSQKPLAAAMTQEDNSAQGEGIRSMNGLMLRTTVAAAILLVTLVAVGYLVAHNVRMNSSCTSLLLTVGVVTRLALDMKIGLKLPLSLLATREETKAKSEHPMRTGVYGFFYVCTIIAFVPLNGFLNGHSPVVGAAINGALIALGINYCVTDIRAAGRHDLPAKYLWMLTASSLLLTIWLIFWCGESIRQEIEATHSGH